MMNENGERGWLSWARELQSIAQAGLTYSQSQYEIERCKQIMEIAAEILARQTNAPMEKIREMFSMEKGYLTPKVDVRGAVFKDDKILLVREVNDGHKWTLPGGWADVGATPAENCEREVFEEAGLRVKATKLAAVFDRTRHVHDDSIWYIYKLFFICEVVGGELTPSHETSEARWFAESELPEESEISIGRSRLYHIQRMFEHSRNPELPTDYD